MLSQTIGACWAITTCLGAFHDRNAIWKGDKAVQVSRVLTRLGVLGLVSGFIMIAQTKSTENRLQGVLIDDKCSGDALTRVVGGSNTHIEGGILWAYTHTRKCALMPECQRSGYGIVTHDNRFLKFDPAGNAKALALIRTTNKEDDLEIAFTGEVHGDQIKIVSLTWQ